MNPFDLRGPEFLLFYAFLALGVIVAFYVMRKHGDEPVDQKSMPEVTDPYLVACLRGGSAEVWRLATITLIDRRLLTVTSDSKVSTPPQVDSKLGQNPVERAALEWFRKPAAAYSIFQETRLNEAIEPYEKRLIELGLKPTANIREKRLSCAILGTLFLVSVSGVKICLALSRGHSNIVFLVPLTVVGVIAIWVMANQPRTPRGNTLLKDMNQLFARLRDHRSAIRAGESTQELAWLAAVFGLSALPAATEFAYARQIYPRAAASSNGGSSSCGSSSCGSSSCGSSCGGGCGGGCGGCGS